MDADVGFSSLSVVLSRTEKGRIGSFIVAVTKISKETVPT